MGRWTDRATHRHGPLEYSPIAYSADSANSLEYATPAVRSAPIHTGRRPPNDAILPVPFIPRFGEEPFGAPQTNDGDEWRVWISERAATREHFAQYETDQADQLAYAEAVEAWCSMYHKAPSPDRCAGCGTVLAVDGFSTGDGARVCDQPDNNCLIEYGTKRKRRAIIALRTMGIDPPKNWALPNGDNS